MVARLVVQTGVRRAALTMATREAWKATEPGIRIRIMACPVVAYKVALKTDKATCRAARYMVAHQVALECKEDHLKATPAA